MTTTWSCACAIAGRYSEQRWRCRLRSHRSVAAARPKSRRSHCRRSPSPYPRRRRALSEYAAAAVLCSAGKISTAKTQWWQHNANAGRYAKVECFCGLHAPCCADGRPAALHVWLSYTRLKRSNFDCTVHFIILLFIYLGTMAFTPNC